MATITILISATLLASCGLWEYIKPKHEHSFVGNKCEECGYLKDSIGLAYKVNGEGTCRIDGIGTCTDKDVKIPEYIDGYKVTEIKGLAFWGIAVEGITIPNTVTKIGSEVFTPGKELEKIIVEEGNPAYHSSGNCLIETASKTIIFGCKNSVIPADGSVTVIGRGAFNYCEDLFSLVIPEGVTSIENLAFSGNGTLWSVTIPASMMNISETAFKDCRDIVEVINRSDLVITVGSTDNGYIAQNAKEVHSGTTKIVNQDGYLFYTWDGVNYLLDYAGSASKVTLPATYNGQPYETYEAVFRGDKNLVSVVISPGVTTIVDSMFYRCVNLVNVTIPDSVTSIGMCAFDSCSSLTNIVIPDSVTSIGDQAFENCSSLTNIEIPDSVTSIGNYAFSDCKSLTNIVISDSVTSMGDYAFSGCSSLMYNEYDNAYYLGNSSNPYLLLLRKAKDKKITSCNINVNTRFIHSYAFSDCYGLTSMVIPDGVTSICDYAFHYCDRLASIVIPDSVTSIGYSAFHGSYRLTSITFEGTKAQWNAISKGDFWNRDTGNYTVHCTDGNIAKSNS